MARSKSTEHNEGNEIQQITKFGSRIKKPSLNNSDIAEVTVKARRRKIHKDKGLVGKPVYRFLQVIPAELCFDENERRKVAEELLEQVSNDSLDLQTELSCMFPHLSDQTIHEVISTCQKDSLKSIDFLLELSNGLNDLPADEHDWMLVDNSESSLCFADQEDDTVLISVDTAQPYLTALLRNL